MQFFNLVHIWRQHLQSKWFKHAPPSNFETLIVNFEVENETLCWGFETQVWNFRKFFGSSLKLFFTNFVIWFVNQLITPSLENEENFKIKVSRKIWNFFQVSTWSFKLSIQSFISKLRSLRSEFRSWGGGGGGGGDMNRSDHKYTLAIPYFYFLLPYSSICYRSCHHFSKMMPVVLQNWFLILSGWF